MVELLYSEEFSTQIKLIPLTDEEQDNHDRALASKMIGQQSDADLVKSVALKSREIPALHAAVEAGHSLWTIAKLVPHITNENKDVWLDRLVTLDKSEVEDRIAKISTRKKRDHIEKGEKHSRLSGDLDKETLELFKQAQALVSKSKRKDASVNEVLKAALETFLQKKDSGSESGSRDWAEESLLCREKLRRTLLVAAEEHIVNARDRGECQAVLPDGGKCGSRFFTEIHHIIARELGGDECAEESHDAL